MILSQEEVKRFLHGVTLIKYRAMFMLAYDSGLRVSEIAKLRIQHIDGKRKLVRVQQGKGRKDRYVRLSEKLLLVLREYWKERQPKEWLFPGRDPDNHINPVSITNQCRTIRQRLGFSKAITPHSFRKACSYYDISLRMAI